MRRLLALVTALIAAALLTGCSSSTEPAVITTVGPQDFISAMAEPGTVVVDVRTPAEYAAGHVDGAVNFDVEAADFPTRIEALAKEDQYAVYCRSGRRSTLATDKMADAGFTSLVNLEGGIADLQAAGAPIVTG